MVAAPIPGELTGVAGGYLYGEKVGLVLSTIGLTIGSWIAFELASILGRPFVERFVSQDVLHKFLNHEYRCDHIFFIISHSGFSQGLSLFSLRSQSNET